MLQKAAGSRQFSGNTVGDYARIIQGNITNVTTNFDAGDRSAADKAFLRKFSKTNPIDNKNRILESKGGLLDDSYHWILEHEQFKKWRYAENSGVLWIKGDPGKGKTMLLCGVLKEFEKYPKMQKRLAYFFCQGTDDKINTSTAIIRGLIYLFLRQYPKLLFRIREENKKEPDDFLEGENERFALCRIFKDVISDPCITDPICIIDALDECQHEESLQSLFSLIVDTSSRVKWLLSSRNEQWIERGLSAVKEHQRLILELKGNSEQVSSAIKAYINHYIQDIHALKDDAELRHRTAELLHAKASGTFLWVTLVVKELHDTSHPHIEAVLQSMPKKLSELYDEILKRAKKRWKTDERACLTTLAVVTAAKRPLSLEELYMFVNPTLRQSEGKYNVHSVKGFVEACGSFISNTNDTIYFIHQSVKDYMVQETNKAVFPSGIADQHFAMFDISISEMNRTLKRHGYPLEKSSSGYIQNIISSNPKPSEPIKYCCTFWVDHLVEGCESQQFRLRECLMNNENLNIFINKRYLYWLEAMMRLRLTTKAVEALHKVHSLIVSCYAGGSEQVPGSVSPATTKNSLTRFLNWILRATGLALKFDTSGKQVVTQILELTRDLYRAVSENRAMIEAIPSQIYVSVLVFSPMKSRLRMTYEAAESPEWLAMKPVVREEWGACLQTIERCYDWARSVALSPDNSKLLSRHIGTIEIWDLTTGAFLQTLNITAFAINAAVVSESNTLALLSSDYIEIWDLVSGSYLKKIHHTGITSAAFIAGDAHLSMLGPNFFTIHDIANNVDLYTYAGQSGEQFHDVVFPPSYVQLALNNSNNSVEAWSPADRTLVPFFRNKTFNARLVMTCKQETSTLLKVVDLATGEYTQTMLKHKKNLDTLLFFLTPDGMQLLVRHSDEMIRVWDLATGLWQTIDLPEKKLTSAAISPCRMRLAMANDENIYVWDVASGEYRWASTGHTDRTTAMAFSPDGSRLALAASNGIIRVLEMTASKPLQSAESRPDSIMEMVYSPNGKWLASLSFNGIKIWDPTTGRCLRTWTSSSNLTALTFSLDSVWLATGDDKGTICVYDVATGKCHQTLASMEHGDGYKSSNTKNDRETLIASIAFSSNGSILASVEPCFHIFDRGFDYILKTWDLATGTCLQAVALSGWVKFRIGMAMMIFSPDNTQLGSILRNGTVIIWDASTGKEIKTLVDHESCYNNYHFKKPGYRKYSMTSEFAESFAQISTYFSRTQGSVSNKAPEVTLSEDGATILWKKHPKIMLPPQYRPNIFAAHKDCCAIATLAHQVLCFKFSA